ncbi:hypothetical protein GMSM_46460 [Geomonas sp. Red276]
MTKNKDLNAAIDNLLKTYKTVNSSCKCTSEGSSKDLSGRPVV